MAGLESTVADRDRELSGQFEGLSTRFDELARLHEQIGSRLEAIAAAHEALRGAGGGGGLEELANQFERLSTRLDELWVAATPSSRAGSKGCRRGSTT